MNKGDMFHMRAVPGSRRAAALGLAVLLGSVSCGDVVRTGKSPVLIVMQSLQAASGAEPGLFSTFLLSDVSVLVEVEGSNQRQETFFNDIGQAELRLEPKDRGLSGTGGSIFPINQVVLNRYHVQFRRADGRGVPGVDVPYGFDGGVSITLGESPVTVPFEIVRHQAKLEPPLRSLAGFGGRLFISTLADVTFYGQDLAGNEIQVMGTMNVSFADYADPE
jgi:hypothetical protein